MIGTIQIAIDAHDPHALNEFWAGTLGYEIEDHDATIGQLIEAGHLTDDDHMERDGKRVFRTAAACTDPDGKGPRLLFQTVPEGKTVKNRVHLDLHLGDRHEQVIADAIARGATKLHDGHLGPDTWVTLADPEGNEFCVSE